MPEGEILSIYQDSRGWIWLGTTNAGLYFYVPELQRFYEAVSHQQLLELLNSYQITALKEGADGELWVGCSNGQIIKVTYTETDSEISAKEPAGLSTKFKVDPVLTAEVRMNRIFNFHVEPSGKILAVGRLNLTLIGEDVDIITFRKPLPWGKYRYRYSSIQDQGNIRFLLTNNTLFELTKDYQLLPLEELNEDNGSIVRFDRLGNVWAVRKNRLYSTQLKDIESVCDEKNYRGSINPKSKLTCLFIDRKENVWVGSSGFGLYKLNGKSGLTENYFDGLSSWQLSQDAKGRLYSWEYNELYVNENGTEKHLWPELSVGPMIETKDGTFWRIDRPAQLSNGVFRLSHLDTNLNLIESYNSQRRIDIAYLRMVEGKSGNIVIAGLENELVIFDTKNEQFRYHYFTETVPTGITEVSHLYEDIDANLWISSKSGLLRASPEDSPEDSPEGNHYQFKTYNNEASENKLPVNATTCTIDLPADPHNFLLVGTQANGLVILNKSTDEYQLIGRTEGLPDNSVLGIIPTDEQTLWLSSYRGISAYNLTTKKVQNFTSKDGLQGDEFNTGSFTKGKAGKVLFGGINGVSVLDPNKITDKGSSAGLRLVNLRINGQLIKPQDETGILPISIENLPPLKLNHDQNNVSIDFSDMSFANAKYSSLRYRLKGADNNWVDAGANQTASFVLLPPGNYTFELQHSFAQDEIQNLLQFQFKIARPWYASWWAFLFYAAVAIAIIYTISAYRRRQYVLQQELAFNAKEKQRLAELDKMKSAFLTNVSHELKTPLTLISGPAEMLRNKYPKERLLGLMNNNVNRLQDLVLQLLDIQKTQAGKQQLAIAEFDVASYLRMLAYSFESWMSSKQLVFRYEQNETSFSGFTDKDKLSKIINNLISNAVKFTSVGGEVVVKSGFEEESQTLTFSVKDDGIGIAKENIELIFDRFYQVEGDEKQGTGIGLALVKELVNLLQGSISVQSSEGNGSTFEVTLPLAKEIWNEASFVIEEAETKEKITAKDELLENEKPLLLLVEDNEDMQDYLEVLLHSDYQIVRANNGIEGLKIARQSIPDIILTDLMMPKMDGLEFSAQIKSKVESSHIPVIMLTAKDTKDTKLKGFETGLDYFLNKPFDSDELRGVLQTVLQNRQHLQSLYQDKFVTESDEFQNVKDSFFNSFKTYLAQHFDNPKLDTGSMAADFNLSNKQFTRKIKALSGSSPKELLRRFRLQKAAKLLKETDDTASEIAYAVGYETLAYFSKSFSDEFGVSPSKYASE